MTLKDIIISREGLRLHVYQDSLGHDTIYYGHLMRPGEVYLFTQADAEKYLDADIFAAKMEAISLFPGFNTFAQSQQDALNELTFNMGETKIRRVFPKFVHDVNIGDFEDAANELKYADGVTKKKLSAWYNEVHSGRADELISMLETGGQKS